MKNERNNRCGKREYDKETNRPIWVECPHYSICPQINYAGNIGEEFCSLVDTIVEETGGVTSIR